MENPDAQRIVKALGIALIEIRASENLATCQALADIFHNVPARLHSGYSAAEIETEILDRAKRFSMQNYIATILGLP